MLKVWLAALSLSACLDLGALPPPVALVIDDLGYQPRYDRAALAVTEVPSYAILPFTPLARALAEELRTAGKEILLHLPMEARAHNDLLGPGALMRAMDRAEFVHAVIGALDAVPYLGGVNNHMGSLLTGDSERMDWLMQTLAAQRPGLVFLDSRTTAASAAGAAARNAAVPYVARDVFLDNNRAPRAINAQLERLVRHAELKGDAIGIAHPHPTTIAVLRERLPALDRVRLVSIARLRAERACHARLASGETPSVVAAAAQREQRRQRATDGEQPHAER